MTVFELYDPALYDVRSDGLANSLSVCLRECGAMAVRRHRTRIVFNDFVRFVFGSVDFGH